MTYPTWFDYAMSPLLIIVGVIVTLIGVELFIGALTAMLRWLASR